MTVQMLINQLNEIKDKNRKIVVNGILRYPFAMANVKQLENSAFGSTVYIVVEEP